MSGERLVALPADLNDPLAGLDSMLEGSRSDNGTIQGDCCIGGGRFDGERRPIGDQNGFQFLWRFSRFEHDGGLVWQVEWCRDFDRVLTGPEFDVVGRSGSRRFPVDCDLGAVYRARGDGQQTSERLKNEADH